MRWIILFLLVFLLSYSTVLGRTLDDLYEQNRAQFNESLNKISDSKKLDKVIKADKLLYEVNQRVCDRLQEDINRLSAIMDEVRSRQDIDETRVAYGQVDTPIENADYWVNWAAEAIAYQRIQDYTPVLGSEAALPKAITAEMNNLRVGLNTLAGKVSKAKAEVGKVVKDEK